MKKSTKHIATISTLLAVITICCKLATIVVTKEDSSIFSNIIAIIVYVVPFTLFAVYINNIIKELRNNT